MTAEGLLRFGLSAGLFALFAAWEAFAPARARAQARAGRWAANLGLGVLNALALRLAAPLGVAGAALWAEEAGAGLFNAVPAPTWAAWIVTILVLDLAVWAQHRASHAAPLLWRLHRVHHLDVDVDASTAYRFHPLEIALSFVWKALVAVALGAPPEAVLLFEALLNGAALFNHANLRLPAWAEAALRPVLVTPAFHRVHHDARPARTNSNYGFLTPWWDHAFGVYAAPEPGAPPLGLTEDRRRRGLLSLLAAPFLDQRAGRGAPTSDSV